MTYNGGKPYWDTFEIKNEFSQGKQSYDSVRYFYGICLDNKSATNNYDIACNIKIRSNRIPAELLPIGTDSLGNEICLGVKGDNYGKIFFWDHENEQMDIKKAPWWPNIYLVANSFSEFLENMFRFDIDDNGNEIKRYQDGTVTITPDKDFVKPSS